MIQRSSWPFLVSLAAMFVAACGGSNDPAAEAGPGTLAREAASTEASDLDFVQTPGGLRVHRSCVHEVANGAFVDSNDDVWVGDRRERHLPRCAHAPRPPTINGWVEYSSAIAPTNPYGFNWYRQLGIDFVVPSAPTSNGGQLIYLFPGLEPTTGNSILQPVLQYGTSPAGGGYYWGMANWYVTASGSAVHSPLVRVNAGDRIRSWVYVPANVACGNDVGVGTYWLYVTPPDRYNWGFQGALEAYNTNTCDQLPATSTTFTRGSVYECGASCATSIAVNPTWTNTVLGGTPSCSYSITALANGATFNY